MELDIRGETVGEITAIRFADKCGEDGCTRVACTMMNGTGAKVSLRDGSEYVYVEGVEHARNLITALEKAITLGWLE